MTEDNKDNWSREDLILRIETLETFSEPVLEAVIEGQKAQREVYGNIAQLVVPQKAIQAAFAQEIELYKKVKELEAQGGDVDKILRALESRRGSNPNAEWALSWIRAGHWKEDSE